MAKTKTAPKPDATTGAAPEAQPAPAPAANGKPKPNYVKTRTCPVTKEQFEEAAKPIQITIDGVPQIIPVKADFSSGSFGWYLNAKAVIKVGDVFVPVQMGLQLIAIGSKPEKTQG